MIHLYISISVNKVAKSLTDVFDSETHNAGPHFVMVMVFVWHTLVRPISAVLEVQYPIVHGKVNIPATEDIIIIRPHPTQLIKTKQKLVKYEYI